VDEIIANCGWSIAEDDAWPDVGDVTGGMPSSFRFSLARSARSVACASPSN